jgi:hypothetical protein
MPPGLAGHLALRLRPASKKSGFVMIAAGHCDDPMQIASGTGLPLVQVAECPDQAMKGGRSPDRPSPAWRGCRADHRKKRRNTQGEREP